MADVYGPHGMTELAFLPVDAETDFENLEDESDCATRSDHSELSSQNLLEKSDVFNNKDDECHHETVEICQSTVNPNNRVNSENFIIQRVIGKGGYGKVFLVQKVDGVDKGKLYAMKVLKKARLVCNEKDKDHTVSERNILEMLRHPFLVRLHYAFQNHSNLYIVLEYCPGGELFNYLEREGSLLENAACFYTSEIILAIGHLHSLGIIYRDLKSENVLLDRQGHVKLTDFGLSKEGVCTTNTFCGTIEYMAPEIIKCEGHGKAVDWWSLGTLLFDMLSGGPPFSQEDSREATTQKILTAPLKFPPSFSPEVISLLRGLLKRDPKERLGSKGDVEEIKKHKFFKRHEINWSDVQHRRLRPPFKPKLLADNDVSMFNPTFTDLQPVVSPPDNARSIPTDLFQGFSYVAPSVCENSFREPWIESSTERRRRQNGTRGAMSTGRLQRIGLVSTTGCSRTSAIRTNGTQKSKVLNTTQPSTLAQPNLIGLDQSTNQTESVHFSIADTDPANQAAGIYKENADEDDDEDDDDDDEVEEENVPGAKQIGVIQRFEEPRTPVKPPVGKANPFGLVHARSGPHLRAGAAMVPGSYRNGFGMLPVSASSASVCATAGQRRVQSPLVKASATNPALSNVPANAQSSSNKCSVM